LTFIEFFVNKHTKDPEFQGQQQYYEVIERIGVCYDCCGNAMHALGMEATIKKLENIVFRPGTVIEQ